MNTCTPIPPPQDAPVRRVPAQPLPPYRYVPGLNPHPFRHEGGHMYTDGSAPEEAPWDPNTDWHTDPRFLYAADLFDHRFYWEAHEAWEALWHSAEPHSSTHRLLQSLIQYAASVLQHHKGSASGAQRLYQRATERLAQVQQDETDLFRGIHLSELSARVDSFLKGGPWPLLPMERS